MTDRPEHDDAAPRGDEDPPAPDEDALSPGDSTEGIDDDLEDEAYDYPFDPAEEDAQDEGEVPQFEPMPTLSPEPKKRSRRPRLRDDDDFSPNDDDDDGLGPRMTLGEHLEELRKCLMRALLGVAVVMVVTLVFGGYLMWFLALPYERVMTDLGLTPEFTDLAPGGGFFLYMKVALIAALIFGSPWVFLQLWTFIATGLYPGERKYVNLAVPFSALLFVTGAAFFLFVVSDFIFAFLIGFDVWLSEFLPGDVKLVPRITLKDYISMVSNMMLAFGLCFQTPLGVLILGKMGIVTVESLNKYRRHVIVAVLIIAAVCTSPSPVDQVMLAIPMWLLYELGILLVYLLVERKEKLQEALEE